MNECLILVRIHIVNINAEEERKEMSNVDFFFQRITDLNNWDRNPGKNSGR